MAEITVEEIAKGYDVSFETFLTRTKKSRETPTVFERGKEKYLNEQKENYMNEVANAKWYTIEELAELCGISVETLKKGDSPLLKLSVDFKVESRLGGYHNTQKFYSENVLKALKEYQIKNSVSNATKNKETAIQGNVSFIQKQTEKTMSLEEIANILGYSSEYLRKKCTELGFTKNGQKTYLTENQVTELKSILVPRTSDMKIRGENATTNLEILENYKKANDDFVALLNRMYEEEKQKREIAEKTLNRIADGKGCFTFNQAAKALKLPYGNKTLFRKLKEQGILNQDNSPNQEQTNNGNFKVVVKFINENIGNKPVTLITSKGLVYLSKKLNTTIDETVKADA
jgi:phage antirepressor YoqD-like protein/AraC-like DNA-binding protein